MKMGQLACLVREGAAEGRFLLSCYCEASLKECEEKRFALQKESCMKLYVTNTEPPLVSAEDDAAENRPG